MILYFLRHGKAGQPRHRGDDVRGLTRGGVQALRAAAPLWRRLNLRPDLVLSSPLARSRQTAELFAEGVDLTHSPVVDDRLAPGADWDDLARTIDEHPGAGRVMFVGHEPDLSRAVALLTGASSIRLRKGGVACVEFAGGPEPGSGELAWLIDPDLYDTDDGT